MRTRGTFSRASSASSAADRTSSPTASSYWKLTRSSRPNWLCRAEADELLGVLAVSFSPSRARRAQSGSSTPNPAPDSSGPVSRRKSSAPAASSPTRAGAASRSAPSSAGNSRAAAPSPASSSSSGCASAASQPSPAPAQTSGAGSIRLGSSVDCSENSTRQLASSLALAASLVIPGSSALPDPQMSGADGAATFTDISGYANSGATAGGAGGSMRRKQVRTGPAGRAAMASHSANADVSSRASRSSSSPSTATRGSDAVRDSTARSITGILAGRRPRRAGSRAPGSRVRAIASARSSSIPASNGPGASSAAARQAAGIAAASSRARCASAADSTGRQRAAYWPSSLIRVGSTRPRVTRSSANRATAAR